MHVLVARLDNAGDLLLLGPAIRAIAVGSDQVTLLVSPRGSEAAQLLPGVDDIITFDAPWVGFDAPAVAAPAIDDLIAEVRRRHVDEAAIFTSFHQSPLPLALLLRLAGVRRIGAISGDYPGALLDVRHLVDDDRHEVERNLSLAAALGHQLRLGDDGRLAIIPGLCPAGRRRSVRRGCYVVVHPGASVPARGLPADRVPAIVAALRDAGWPVVVTGQAGDLAGRTVDTIDLTGRTDLSTLADVIADAAAIVTGNTGPAHLAAAVGTPVVSVFAPTVPAQRWRPWRVPHILIGDQAIACAGCRSRVCPRHGQPCLDPVTPEMVVLAVRSLAGTAPVDHEGAVVLTEPAAS